MLLLAPRDPERSRDTRHSAGRPPFDVLYRPATFVAPGKRVVLRYEIVCPLTRPPEPGFCTPGGTLHVRRAGSSQFGSIPLKSPRTHLATATVPAEYASGAGFDYYAEIRDERGRVRTVPRGGPAAALRAWMVDRWTTVALGGHRFGRTRIPTTVLAARWGGGRRQVGRHRGIGPSAFTVLADGTIVVLDQVNRRLAVYRGAKPTYAPITFLGGEGDVASAPDRTVYVLDAGRARAHVAFVRSYGDEFAPLGETSVAEAPADRLHAGADGAAVHAVASDQWLPVGRGSDLLAPEEQIAGARSTLEFPGGDEVAVLASGRGARFAVFRDGRLARSWLVTSATPLGEVQFAEPFGDGLLVVLRVHTGRRAEWEVLALARNGLRARFSARRVEGAGAAAGGRFRLRGGLLYALESGRSGVEVVRYTLPTG